MKFDTSLIIGNGQVGKALYQLIKEYRSVVIYDRLNQPKTNQRFNVLHICFPYTSEFVDEVKKYQLKYHSDLTIIHSTVPPGTSEKCNACHSPVRGSHPFLLNSLKTFIKFVGGENADFVAEYFREMGVKIKICRKAKTTEVGKILSTNYYVTCIEFVKEAETICKKFNIPFSEAFTLFQETYNDGWEKLGYSEYKRPLLEPIQLKLGGHCCLPNLDFIENDFFQFIKKHSNKKRVE